jgi:hypothetical protein
MTSQVDTIKPVDNRESLAKRALAQSLCKTSLYFLGKEVLGYNKFCSSQVEWDKWIRAEVDLTGRKSGMYLILQPRETFKTSFFTVTLAICLILNNPEISILIANERIENSKDMLREIKRHFEQNEKLRSLFGNYVSLTMWAEHSITINRKTKNIKEPTIWVSGIGAAITSKHPDVILCDDIAGRKDKESEAGRQETMSFFQDSWDLLKKESGMFFLTGTRKHLSDIYNHVKTVLDKKLRREGFDGFKILETPAHKNGDVNGELNFPRILSERKLQELRIVKVDKDGMDIATYMAEYELNPLSPNEQIFKTFHFEDIATLQFDQFVLWTDPALTDKGTSCYSAIIVLAKVKAADYWFCPYASIARRDPSKIIADHNRIYNMIISLYKINGDAFMESNGFQMLLKNQAVKASTDAGEAIPTTGRSNQENKPARIRSLEPFVSQAFIRFRKDWETAPECYRLLIDQLLSFPQGMLDGPDALESCHKQTRSRFRA